MADFARWQATIVDDAGNVIPAASIEVRREIGGQPLAPLYSDRLGATPIGNPFDADADGFAAFHVAGGAYQIVATSGVFSRTWRYVAIGTAAELDDDQIAILGVDFREYLTDARIYYVRTDGDDNNDGLSNTVGGAFLTIQKGIDTALGLDANGFDVTIKVADGTYTTGVGNIIERPLIGGGKLIIEGNTSTPANCLVNGSPALPLFYAANPSVRVLVKGFKLSTGANAHLLEADNLATIDAENMDFGSAGAGWAQVVASREGIADISESNQTISGGGASHLKAVKKGLVRARSNTATLTGTPAFTEAFAVTEDDGLILAGQTYSGGATGKRFEIDGTSWIADLTPTLFPGDAAGTSARREVLIANRTYYVRTDGSDNNTGLANTAGGAFLTMQKAMDVVSATLDLAGFEVIIQIGTGPWTAAVTAKQVIGGKCTFRGDTATPANVVWSVTGADLFRVEDCRGSIFRLEGFDFRTITSGDVIDIRDQSSIAEWGSCIFGACAGAHINCGSGRARSIAAYTINGNAIRHVFAFGNQARVTLNVAITVSGTPAFSVAFADAEDIGFITSSGAITGGATGKRYDADKNAVIDAFGNGANYFPGDVAGTTATGGQYA